MNFPLIANIVVFVVLLLLLAQARQQTVEPGENTLVGLVMGVVFGLALHAIYGPIARYWKIPFSGSTLSVTAMYSCCK